MDNEIIKCNVCDEVMVWNEKGREWVCPECGNRAFRDKKNDIYYEHQSRDEYDEIYK